MNWDQFEQMTAGWFNTFRLKTTNCELCETQRKWHLSECTSWWGSAGRTVEVVGVRWIVGYWGPNHTAGVVLDRIRLQVSESLKQALRHIRSGLQTLGMNWVAVYLLMYVRCMMGTHMVFCKCLLCFLCIYESVFMVLLPECRPVDGLFSWWGTNGRRWAVGVRFITLLTFIR